MYAKVSGTPCICSLGGKKCANHVYHRMLATHKNVRRPNLFLAKLSIIVNRQQTFLKKTIQTFSYSQSVSIRNKFCQKSLTSAVGAGMRAAGFLLAALASTYKVKLCLAPGFLRCSLGWIKRKNDEDGLGPMRGGNSLTPKSPESPCSA